MGWVLLNCLGETKLRHLTRLVLEVLAVKDSRDYTSGINTGVDSPDQRIQTHGRVSYATAYFSSTGLRKMILTLTSGHKDSWTKREWTEPD